MTVAVDNPLPYLPIRIVDVSPYRSSIRHDRASTAGPRRARRRVVAVALSVVGLAVIASAVGAAPIARDPSPEFRLAPGHAMPLSLGAPSGGASRGAMTGFRLAPGHAMPASLGR